eukprot:c9435_g1_i1 orf=182-349(+)
MRRLTETTATESEHRQTLQKKLSVNGKVIYITCVRQIPTLILTKTLDFNVMSFCR